MQKVNFFRCFLNPSITPNAVPRPALSPPQAPHGTGRRLKHSTPKRAGARSSRGCCQRPSPKPKPAFSPEGFGDLLASTTRATRLPSASAQRDGSPAAAPPVMAPAPVPGTARPAGTAGKKGSRRRLAKLGDPSGGGSPCGSASCSSSTLSSTQSRMAGAARARRRRGGRGAGRGGPGAPQRGGAGAGAGALPPPHSIPRWKPGVRSGAAAAGRSGTPGEGCS